MASQPKKKPGKEGKGEAFKAEDVLQAIIIADSFNERFKPITLQTPRALLPVANCPTIEYTLEFLASVGVQEILIFCRAHAEKIRSYIQSHAKWGGKGRRHRSVTVQVIVSEDCYSMGDALREIDAKNLIRGDFILVQGDLVANVDLQPALDAHRQRRTVERNSVMTVVCRQVASRHPARSLEDQVVLTVEPANQRILHFQKSPSGKKIRFPTEVLDNRDDVEIRCDILDCHISICSPQVPPLFTDNFDYLTRDDFISGILEHEEVQGNTIHCFVLQAGYTARISNLHMYDTVSRDIIGRWVYPFCPDLGFPSGAGDVAYIYKRHHIYQQRDVQLAMGSVLEENVVVGRGCVIGENSVVRNSVIGNGCRIGANCVIDGAYIWDGCTVEAECQIQKCVIAGGCWIGRGSVVASGVILSYGVRVGPDARLPVGTRLVGKADFQSITDEAEDSEREGPVFTTNAAEKTILGGSTEPAWRFSLSNGADSDTESDSPGINFEEASWTWWSLANPITVDEEIPEDDSSADEDDAETEPEDEQDIPSSGKPRRPVVKNVKAFIPIEDRRIFFNEISDSLLRAVDSDHEVGSDNIILEINSSKFAYNIAMDDVNKLIIRSILEIPEIRARQRKRELTSAKEVFGEVFHGLKILLPVLRNYYRSELSQMSALTSIVECAVNYVDLPRHQPYGAHLHESVMKIVKYLYDQDILAEEVILKWHRGASDEQVLSFLPFFLHEIASQASPRRRHVSGDLTDEDMTALARKVDLLKAKLEPFIKWLQEAEEESE
ncbi:Translation initiation factor eIF-2B subunit epsilon [Hypsibius exemplaris]|uniref:Translation initiation factor eIF2B subunit epsilon n=1 Tax=Hypsibius exemplaris TaxID=2072580 RepID=A0A1W0WV68_HYPEX|nr:Translation initiation factor eIF-2B subunit epsilon [Hypsibius exemplaris]